MGLVLLSQGFEVSPLPEWTLFAFVFLMQFLTTFVCAVLAIRRHLPGRAERIILAVAFLLVETILEVELSLFLSHGTWRDITSAFGWMTLIPLASYFLALSLAVHYKRRKILQAHLPEGVSFNAN